MMPFVEVFGNVGTIPPSHMDKLVPMPKTGVMFEVTVTLNVYGSAQRPSAGVKMYVPLD